MANARVDMKGFYKQKKKGNTGISKPSPKGGKKKSPPSASIGSNVAQSPALVCRNGSLDLQDDYDQNEEMLRQFDMNMVYGPCIGLSRIDRLNRARKLGLNPPEEIENLITSDKVRPESLWDGRV